MQIKGTKDWLRDYRRKNKKFKCCCTYYSKGNIKTKSYRKWLNRYTTYELQDLELDLGPAYFPIKQRIT